MNSMTLTKKDLSEIEILIDQKLDEKLDQKFHENNIKLAQIFVTRDEVRQIIHDETDPKFQEIKDILGPMADILADIKLQIDRERIPFIESTLEKTQDRVTTLETRMKDVEVKLDTN